MKTLPELQSLGKTEEGKDRLRVMLAELVGWTIHQIKTAGMDDVAVLPPGVALSDESIWRYAGTCLPDYPRDLNAVHEIELSLKPDVERHEWRAYLEQICRTMNGMLHATATERTIALICVLQKQNNQSQP